MKNKSTISELEPKGQLEGIDDEDTGYSYMPVKKRRRLVAPMPVVIAIMPVALCTSSTYPVPVGRTWSRNSCAYDSVFTILFAIWCNNKVTWNRIFDNTGNIFSILLADQFLKYDRKLVF